MHVNYKVETGIEQKAAFPKRVIFFRDGVSEGQFKQVIDDGMRLPRQSFRASADSHSFQKFRRSRVCSSLLATTASLIPYSRLCRFEVPRRAKAHGRRRGQAPSWYVPVNCPETVLDKL